MAMESAKICSQAKRIRYPMVHGSVMKKDLSSRKRTGFMWTRLQDYIANIQMIHMLEVLVG